MDELAAVARDPEPLVLPAIEPLVAPDDFPVDFEPALVDLDPVEVAELFPEEPLPDDEAPALPDEPLVEPLEVELELEAAAELLPVVVEDDFPPVDEARLLAATALPLLAELPRVPEPAVRDPELPLLLAVDPDEAPVDVPTDPELAAAWLPEAVALERVTTPVVDPLVDAPVEPELP